MDVSGIARAAAAVLLLLGLAVAGAGAADLTGDSRNDSPILPTDDQFNTLSRDEVQQILNKLNVVPPPDANTKTELRRVITNVELFRIDPKNGNNPFNTEDPINNATVNGIVQQVAVDDLNNNDNGNNNGAGLDACIGQTLQGQLSPTAPPDLRFVNMVVDPVTLDCRIFAGQSVDGAFLIFQYSPGALDLTVQGDETVTIFPDATVPVWRIIDPAGGFIFINPFVAAQTVRIVLQANNGVTVEGTFTLTPIGFTEFSVTVVNLVVQ
ncbi:MULTISPECIES: hypothetical protein [unclassified Minwuia]|jgi:hypothetical protein|uniref:hypothetical protein n=1 Tax=unclassified Minwuia TaxID=2618799 RepID=UPI0024793D79|nr:MULTISPECIES: hypothetical protein [unclassified Minwuia]